MRIIGGNRRGAVIEAPAGMETRPTLDRVRENLFNILQMHVLDADVLDLFAGSGALSLEALSRGAASAVLVDHNKTAVSCEQKNLAKLRMADRAQILNMDWSAALAQLSRQHRKFNLVFLDPPYAMNDLSALSESLRSVLAEDALVVVEHQAQQPSLMADGYILKDSRHYGYCGLSFYSDRQEHR